MLIMTIIGICNFFSKYIFLIWWLLNRLDYIEQWVSWLKYVYHWRPCEFVYSDNTLFYLGLRNWTSTVNFLFIHLGTYADCDVTSSDTSDEDDIDIRRKLKRKVEESDEDINCDFGQYWHVSIISLTRIWLLK